MERKSSIARKVGIGVGITVLVLIVIGVVCAVTVGSLMADIEEETQGERVLRYLNELELRLTRAELLAVQCAVNPDTQRELRSVEIKSLMNELDEMVALKRSELDFPTLRRHLDERVKLLNEVVRQANEGEGQAALALLNNDQSRFLGNELKQDLETIRSGQELLLAQTSKRASERRPQVGVTIALEAFLAFLMIYVMGRAVVRDLTFPLQRLVAGIEQIREGKLDYRVEITSSDEVGQLSRAFNKMAEELEQGRGLRKDAEIALQDSNIQLADRVEALRRRNQEIEEMSRLTELLQTALRAEEAYEVVARFGERIFPESAGTLLLANSSRTFLEAVTGWGESHSERVFNTEDCWALRRGRPHHAVEPGALHCQHFTGAGNTLCIPLVAQGEALGVLCLEGAQLEEQLAVTVSEQLSLALANLRLRETLRNQSIRDALTGLFNRRFLEESMDREMHRARRNELSLGVLMVDIDHFKQFNDDFGHEAGDAVLQALGHMFKTSVRAEDVPCRYGGEEFALLLPGASLKTAAERAETLRQAAMELKVVSGGRSVGSITLSIGVAAFPQHGQDVSEVIRVADEALYRAKRAGRNQVQLGKEPENGEPRTKEPDTTVVEGSLGGASLS